MTDVIKPERPIRYDTLLAPFWQQNEVEPTIPSNKERIENAKKQCLNGEYDQLIETINAHRDACRNITPHITSGKSKGFGIYIRDVRKHDSKKYTESSGMVASAAAYLRGLHRLLDAIGKEESKKLITSLQKSLASKLDILMDPTISVAKQHKEIRSIIKNYIHLLYQHNAMSSEHEAALALDRAREYHDLENEHFHVFTILKCEEKHYALSEQPFSQKWRLNSLTLPLKNQNKQDITLGNTTDFHKHNRHKMLPSSMRKVSMRNKQGEGKNMIEEGIINAYRMQLYYQDQKKNTTTSLLSRVSHSGTLVPLFGTQKERINKTRNALKALFPAGSNEEEEFCLSISLNSPAIEGITGKVVNRFVESQDEQDIIDITENAVAGLEREASQKSEYGKKRQHWGFANLVFNGTRIFTKKEQENRSGIETYLKRLDRSFIKLELKHQNALDVMLLGKTKAKKKPNSAMELPEGQAGRIMLLSGMIRCLLSQSGEMKINIKYNLGAWVVALLASLANEVHLAKINSYNLHLDMAQLPRLAMHFFCKSGKDRTGTEAAMITTATIVWHQQADCFIKLFNKEKSIERCCQQFLDNTIKPLEQISDSGHYQHLTASNAGFPGAYSIKGGAGFIGTAHQESAASLVRETCNYNSMDTQIDTILDKKTAEKWSSTKQKTAPEVITKDNHTGSKGEEPIKLTVELIRQSSSKALDKLFANQNSPHQETKSKVQTLIERFDRQQLNYGIAVK